MVPESPFALFIVALFRTRTVNFAELAGAFVGKAQTESNLKRLYRFFSDFELDYLTLAKLVVALMEIPQPWTLSLDRTTWEFGSCCHNILMLGVVHKRVAFPLFWWMLDKKGNSNTEERIDLLGEFFLAFPSVKVADLTADREFLGEEWFEYLLEQCGSRLALEFAVYPLDSFRSLVGCSGWTALCSLRLRLGRECCQNLW